MLLLRKNLILFYLFEFEQNVRSTACSVHPQYPIRRQNEERFFTCFLLFNQKNKNMAKVVKQVVGIDVAQDELVVCFGKQYEDFSFKIISRKKFINEKSGFEKLMKWLEPLTDKEAHLCFVMEATGVYHENFAYYLSGKGYNVSIILPNKMSNYFKTLTVKTITDDTMSEVIMQFGIERKLDNWQAPKGVYRKLQQLTRERSQLIEESTVIKNQVHAEKASAFPSKKSLARCNKRLALLEKQEAEIKAELDELIKSDEEVQRIVILLCSISGIGKLTASTVLGETNGFNLIRNKRQLASYAGFDVIEKQSGTSVKGKSRISKKGNKHLRKAMHLPALSAIRSDERFKAVFARIVSKHGIKMKAAVAVQRKLLEMTYTIFKTGKRYDKKYLQKMNEDKMEETEAIKVA
jgi:transposase